MTNGHGYVIKKQFTGGKDNLGVEILKGRNVASVKNSVQDAELLLLQVPRVFCTWQNVLFMQAEEDSPL